MVRDGATGNLDIQVQVFRGLGLLPLTEPHAPASHPAPGPGVSAAACARRRRAAAPSGLEGGRGAAATLAAGPALPNLRELGTHLEARAKLLKWAGFCCLFKSGAQLLDQIGWNIIDEGEK